MAAGIEGTKSFSVELTRDSKAVLLGSLNKWNVAYVTDLFIEDDEETFGFRDAAQAADRIAQIIQDGPSEKTQIFVTESETDILSIAVLEEQDEAFRIHALASNPDTSGIVFSESKKRYECDILELLAETAKAKGKPLEVVAHMTTSEYVDSSEPYFFEQAGFDTLEEDHDAGEYLMRYDTASHVDGRITARISPALRSPDSI